MIRTPMKRGRSRVGQAAARRRRAGGKLAVGRDSATRGELSVEREYVKARNQGWCEIGCSQAPCEAGAPVMPATDFAHVVARSQGGQDDRYNALWLCRTHHRMMEAPYAQGRLLVHRVSHSGVRGYEWEIVVAAGKHAFRVGQFTTLAAGFIRAE